MPNCPAVEWTDYSEFRTVTFRRRSACRLPFHGTACVRSDPRLPGAMLYMTSWSKAMRTMHTTLKTEAGDGYRNPAIGPYDDPADVVSVEVKAPQLRWHAQCRCPLFIRKARK